MDGEYTIIHMLPAEMGEEEARGKIDGNDLID